MANIFLPDWELSTNLQDPSLSKYILSLSDLCNVFGHKPCETPYGFVYLIIFSDGSKYIGKKVFLNTNKVKKGKRELAAMADKRGSKKKIVQKESNWKKYYGSFKNEEFLQKLNSGDVTILSRQIIDLGQTKSHLTYLETMYLFKFDVLSDDKFINDNILGKFYRKSFLFGDDE